MEDVRVYAEKPNTRGMKIKEAGFYIGKEAGLFTFKRKTKLGLLVDIPPSSSKKLLKSVNFRLFNKNSTKNIRKKDVALEIKIYAIKMVQ